ncbi:hypothetical protein B0H17DRAFT_965620, partial [Mycena rosella]
VCHNRINSKFEALKLYVCESSLCMYQYYKHNRGAPLEYEIMYNPETVDLLIWVMYCSAAEGAIDQPLPSAWCCASRRPTRCASPSRSPRHTRCIQTRTRRRRRRHRSPRRTRPEPMAS